MKRTTKHIGNALILLSLIGFVVLFFPLLRTYFIPSQMNLSPTPSEAFRIAIPKIKAFSPVIANVDPWNEQTYRQALRRGVAHAKGSGLPGSHNTVYLFAHSTGAPWDELYFNTIFLRLGELASGDEIFLDLHKKRYVYKVIEKKEVKPGDIQYLLNITQDRLILQTCTPIGTSLRRLLVFAQPVTITGDATRALR